MEEPATGVQGGCGKLPRDCRRNQAEGSSDRDICLVRVPIHDENANRRSVCRSGIMGVGKAQSAAALREE